MINFNKKTVASTIMDPRKGFDRNSINTEIRIDPLTGESGRLAHFGMIKIQKDDFSSWNTPDTRKNCPFCPANIETLTPRFPPEILPEGFLQKGEARVIPNISPYDQYSSLTIISREHLVPLLNFNKKMLIDAFNAGIEFFKLVSQKEPQLPYFILTWNYMPPSGGGLIHPHHQLIITAFPGNLYRKTYVNSKLFYERSGNNYWAELCKVEESRKERYIGQIGRGHWIVPFVSLGVLGEYNVVFPEVHTIFDLSEADIEDLVAGLLRLFKYFDSKGIYSFNMGLFFAPVGQAENYFSLHARIIPRTYLNPFLKPSDVNSLQMILQEPFSVEIPEQLCKELAVFWK